MVVRNWICFCVIFAGSGGPGCAINSVVAIPNNNSMISVVFLIVFILFDPPNVLFYVFPPWQTAEPSLGLTLRQLSDIRCELATSERPRSGVAQLLRERWDRLRERTQQQMRACE